jgi:hypothetical protein
MRRRLTALPAAFLACAALAQPSPSNPDWREADAPPPPALRTSELVPLDMPGSNLKFGVDPNSVSIGTDSIVRYVVVATSATGAVNAMYEGIRCDKGEWRVYARHTPGAGWSPADTEWRAIDGSSTSRHTLAIARNGACIGQGPNLSAAQVVRDLKASPEWRFRPELR